MKVIFMDGSTGDVGGERVLSLGDILPCQHINGVIYDCEVIQLVTTKSRVKILRVNTIFFKMVLDEFSKYNLP